MACGWKNKENEEKNMRQTITISIPDGGSFDIQVDHEQRIKTTLRVLGENMMGLEWLLGDVIIREKRSGRKIDLEQTYEEAKIYTGFEIVVTPRKQYRKEKNLC